MTAGSYIMSIIKFIIPLAVGARIHFFYPKFLLILSIIVIKLGSFNLRSLCYCIDRRVRSRVFYPTLEQQRKLYDGGFLSLVFVPGGAHLFVREVNLLIRYLFLCSKIYMASADFMST